MKEFRGNFNDGDPFCLRIDNVIDEKEEELAQMTQGPTAFHLSKKQNIINYMVVVMLRIND